MFEAITTSHVPSNYSLIKCLLLVKYVLDAGDTAKNKTDKTLSTCIHSLASPEIGLNLTSERLLFSSQIFHHSYKLFEMGTYGEYMWQSWCWHHFSNNGFNHLKIWSQEFRILHMTSNFLLTFSVEFAFKSNLAILNYQAMEEAFRRIFL